MRKRGDTIGKRGISTIVATVLLVLIVVAAVTVLWAAVFPLINQAAHVESPEVQYKIEKSEFTFFDSDNDMLSLQVTRGADEENIIGQRFIVTDVSGNTHDYVSYDPVSANGAKVFYFRIDAGSISEVSIVPIYEVASEEVDGSRKSTLTSVAERPAILNSYNGSCPPSLGENNTVQEKVLSYLSSESLGLYMDMDDVIAGDPQDESGNGNHGDARAGASQNTAGFINNSFSFGGTDDRIVFVDSATLNLLDSHERTISLWFKASDTLSRSVLYEGGGVNNGFNIYLDANTLYAGFWGSDVANTWLSTPFFDTTSWHHVVLLFDGDSSEQSLYLSLIHI